MINSITKVKFFSKNLIKKIFVFFIFFNLFFLITTSINADSTDRFVPVKYIDTVAVSAIVVDLNSDRIFWSKNPDMLLYPASLTKMLTAITAIENIDDLSKKVKISKNASGINHSSFRFRKGDEISLNDLLKAALISSHNNATIALAEYVCENEKDFIDLMNKKALEIGAKNTYFQTTNGLDSDFPNHKTTASDLIKITKYCLKNDLFRKIVATKTDIILINDKEIELKNTNALLEYDYIKGVKTGYTLNAGFCLVTYAQKDGLELLAVALKSSPYGKNYDSLRLINWVYDNYKKVKIVDSKKIIESVYIKDESGELKIDLYPQKDYESFLSISEDKYLINYEIDKDISLPIKGKSVFGNLDVYINGVFMEKINIIADKNIEIAIDK